MFLSHPWGMASVTRHLVLYHTEDSHGAERKALYSAEGRAFYEGDLYVPDDLDVINL